MKKAFILITALASIFTFGCKRAEKTEVSATTVNTADLAGTWKIQSLEKAGVQQQIALSDITFEAKSEEVYSVSGNSGVNQFFGDVTVKNGKLTAGDNMASTKMAGAPEAMEFEDNFLACLIKADAVEVAGNTLKISSTEAASVLTFVKAE
ncbi:MAG: META domain-containing protein [Treponema sp.]|nr:META domain-containing protein [Candidatus Treponema equifaecale]